MLPNPHDLLILLGLFIAAYGLILVPQLITVPFTLIYRILDALLAQVLGPSKR